MNSRTFSIITVCFNAIQTLPATAASLAAQRGADYEWVVVDGASTDGTAEWVRVQGDAVSRFVSEKDGGIYDAMNKAVSMATGEWVYFLNADDRLADPEVLADVARAASEDLDLIYGNVVYTDGERRWPKHFHWLRGRNLVFSDLCHQAVFARRTLFDEVGAFDLSLRYNADFDWLLRVFRKPARTLYLRRDICLFFHGGAHVINAAASEVERYEVRHRYVRPWLWRLGNFALRVELKLRRLRGEAT